jgi:hypothetical protein
MASAAASSAAGDATPASSDRRVQPRHFHTAPNPVPGDDMLTALEGDVSASPPSTAGRLYRHALESVFAFCSLKELVPFLRVSKEWAAAVGSMRPLAVDLPYTGSDARLLRFCMSPLSRHVSKASVWMFPLSCWSLYHLTQRMPNLQELSCHFTGSWSSLMFPARLLNLTLRFQATADDREPFADQQHRELDDAIVFIAALPLLEELSITASKARSCCLTPLATALALRTLTLYLDTSVLESPVVIETLRHMPHLRSLDFNPSPGGLQRMLQTPHAMRLESLRIPHAVITANAGQSVAQLPSLTELMFTLCSPHTDFLCQLPNLRCLHLCTCNEVESDADRTMASMHSLTSLTELQLDSSFDGDRFPLRYTSAYFAACLPHMPLLSNLQLFHATALDSLRFLSSGPITSSLKELRLGYFDPRLPLSELRHVHALSSLTKLSLCYVFDRPLDEYTQSLYTPPSPLLPALREFEYEFEASDYEEDGEED